MCITIYYAGFYGQNAKETSNTATAKTDSVSEDSITNSSETTMADKESNDLETKDHSNSSDDNTKQDTSETSSVTALSGNPLKDLPSGTIINTKELGDTLMDNGFYYEDISDAVKERINGKSYADGCTTGYNELTYVRVLYYGFDSETHIGELIVNKIIADDIIAIFKELYEAKYPIEKMVLIDEYNADDNASMAADNTSSFNYRTVPGSTNLSNHALGIAIDINPLYNPYVQYHADRTEILPEEGKKYADRTLDCPYYIKKDDICYNAFIKRGFIWGGNWETEPDYQHFEKDLDLSN